MNDTKLIHMLTKLNTLTPREEILASIKRQVFDAIDTQSAPVISPVQPARFVSPINTLSYGMFASMGVAFAIVLVVANQLPMHGAYQDSIASVAQANRIADTLEKSEYPVASAHEVRVATEKARATLDTLKLKGALGIYTQAQCLQAYTIYDSYLDYLGDVLDGKLAATENPEALAAYTDLRAYVEDSHQEAQRRITMYPPQK